MNTTQMCDKCLKEYEPEEIDNIRHLKTYKGFTIDLRLKQFRKANIVEELVFIEFDSKEGQKLLAEMHTQLMN